MAPKPRTYCIGNGVSTFAPPSKKSPFPLFEKAAAAAQTALDEAGVGYDAVDAVVCGYAFSDSTAGQAAAYRLGLTGVPVYNVNNSCASGSTALCLARTMVQSGSHNCVLALGFEQLKGNVTEAYPEHSVYGGHLATLERLGVTTIPGMISGSIANAYIRAAKEYAARVGADAQTFAKVAHKNLRHGQNNPAALSFGKPVPSVQDVLAAPRLFDETSPLTFAMVAKAACGAAAALIVSDTFLRSCSHLAAFAPVEIVGQALRTDTAATFDDKGDPMGTLANLCGFDGSRRAADAAFGEATLSPIDIDVAEVHDAFSSNEMVMTEAVRLCEDGGGPRFVDSGEWRSNGQGGELYHQPKLKGAATVVINPSGGLESKGHPTGATGVAQCAEICWQLRGVAGKRQVPGAKVGLQHNYGWSSAAVVTLYRSVAAGGGTSRL